MAKVTGFRTRKHLGEKQVYPITEAKGFKVPKGMTTQQKYRQAVQTHTRRGRPEPEGWSSSTSYMMRNQEHLQKSLDYYKRKGCETLVIQRGSRNYVYYRKPEEAKPHPKVVKKPITKPEPKEPEPKVKKKRVKIPKKKRPPPKKLTHIERMHLLAACKQWNIDPQEIDNELTYYENKKHVHDLARMRGVSEWQISSSEKEAKQWASQYEGYLSQLRSELESAGYEVKTP